MTTGAGYLRWMRREGRFTLPEIRRYLHRLSLVEGALILFLFQRRGGAGAAAADAIVDVLRGLDARLVGFRCERGRGGLKVLAQRAGWLERALLPSAFEELPRAELRHFLVAELTRRGARAARRAVRDARRVPVSP